MKKIVFDSVSISGSSLTPEQQLQIFPYWEFGGITDAGMTNVPPGSGNVTYNSNYIIECTSIYNRLFNLVKTWEYFSWSSPTITCKSGTATVIIFISGAKCIRFYPDYENYPYNFFEMIIDNTYYGQNSNAKCIGYLHMNGDTCDNIFCEKYYPGWPSHRFDKYTQSQIDTFNEFLSNAKFVELNPKFGYNTKPRTPDGSWDLHHESIDFPALPDNGAQSAGMISLFHPDNATLHTLGRFLWSDSFFSTLNTIYVKVFGNPMDYIIGLNLFPLDLSSLDTTDDYKLRVGWFSVNDPDTALPIACPKLTSQWVEIDCGSITMDEFYASCLDYSPHTKLSIVVPYCGTYQLNVDDILTNMDGAWDGKAGSTISLKYHVDLFSGVCVAMLKCGDTLLYQWSGSMAMNVPLSGQDYVRAIQNGISVATTIALAASTGAGPAAADMAAEKTAEAAKSAGGSDSSEGGSGSGIGSTIAAGAKSVLRTAGSLTRATGETVLTSSGNAITNFKPTVQRSGSSAGASGFLANQTPYIIMEKPKQAINIDEYSSQIGWPSGCAYAISSCSGFTKVAYVHLTNMKVNIASSDYINATDQELTEIESLLKGGVIV